jgi:rubrerythrin
MYEDALSLGFDGKLPPKSMEENLEELMGDIDLDEMGVLACSNCDCVVSTEDAVCPDCGENPF